MGSRHDMLVMGMQNKLGYMYVCMYVCICVTVHVPSKVPLPWSSAHAHMHAILQANFKFTDDKNNNIIFAIADDNRCTKH